jgi:hypothetical protein
LQRQQPEPPNKSNKINQILYFPIHDSTRYIIMFNKTINEKIFHT